MLDIAWPELLVIGIVAVVAIGPKDLPKVMNTLGRFAGKARMMAQDVQRSMEQLTYEAEVANKLKQDIVPQAEAAPVTPPHAKHQHHAPAHVLPPETKDTSHEPPGT